ncbi:MAG: monovalent cation/H+ antiporter subunit A, partial [Bartonella sp.]|nr:monovalent cation/H+ antiporter subunit A [Bartonella sp.]
EGVPLFRSLKRLRIFERIFMIIFWKWPCVAESFLSTRRLQVQLCWVLFVCFAFVGLLLWCDGLISAGPLPLFPLDFSFIVIWLIGGFCAFLVAWQAKFHRFVSLMLLGGA